MAKDTRLRILDTALAMFNEHGLHAVGIREIARALGISPGNLAYHFPKKEALVTALVQELHDSNNQAAVRSSSAGPVTLLSLYASIVSVMRNHLAYRFYLLSYVDVMRTSPEIRSFEASLAEARQRRTRMVLQALIQEGYLEGTLLLQRLDRLHELWTIMMTSWLRAAEIEMPRRPDTDVLRHYAKLSVSLFEPYCTARGQVQMARILAGEFDPEIVGVEPDDASEPGRNVLRASPKARAFFFSEPPER